MDAACDNDVLFMEYALEQARRAVRLGEVPVGAVVVREGRVLARAHNLREILGDPTAHAEVLAIRRAAVALGGWRLPGCVLYVTVEPCAMCAGAAVLARLDRLVYGARDPKAGACGSVLDVLSCEAFNHRVEVTGGVLEEQCAGLISQFFRARR